MPAGGRRTPNWPRPSGSATGSRSRRRPGAGRLLAGREPLHGRPAHRASPGPELASWWTCSTRSMPGTCWRRSAGPSDDWHEDLDRRIRRRSSTRRFRVWPRTAGSSPSGWPCSPRWSRASRGRPPRSKEVGGTEGVGVAFLEETFSSAAAPPEHRYHQKAARAVLKALLPESGHGHQGPHAVVGRVAGGVGLRQPSEGLRRPDPHSRRRSPAHHADRPRRQRGGGGIHVPGPAGQKYYQLTHDYLVPSLRDWLTRKQKETRRGRAELLLADRAASGTPARRTGNCRRCRNGSSIRWLTAKKDWTPPQRKMMGKATRYHAVRAAALGVLLAVATCTGLAIREQVVEQQKATHAAGLVQAVLECGHGAGAGRRRRDVRVSQMGRSSAAAEANDKAADELRPADNCTPALPCCRWTPRRWTTCTAGCSTRNRTKCR